VRKATENELEM